MRFTREIAGCAAVATPDDRNDQHPLTITPKLAVVDLSSSTQVSVATFRFDGTPVDTGFSLAVFR